MIYKVLSLHYLHLFLPLAAVFLLGTSGITGKIFAFLPEAWFLRCCVHSRKRKLARPGSIFLAFCHATFHHDLITCCNVLARAKPRVGYIAFSVKAM